MRINFAFSKCFVIVAIAGVSTAAFGDKTRKLPPPPKVKAIRESTARVFPQIQPTPGNIRREHENPFEENFKTWFKEGEPNNLTFGSTEDIQRILVPTGPGAKFPGIENTGWVPADPTAAVSSTHVVETVNTDLAFFDRAGNKLFQQNMAGSAGFFGSLNPTDFVFDPKCFFDPATKRFFVVALDEDDATKVSNFLIAVSDDENPQGNWNKYKIQNKLVVGSSEYWLDYPGWGFNKDWVVASGNMFPLPGTGGFGGVQVFAFNKANLIAGNTGGSLRFAADTFTLQWAKNYDPTSNVVYGVADGTSTSMNLFALKGSDANAQLVSTSVAVPSWTRPQVGSTSTGGVALDPLDGRILTAAYRNGHIAASHTVSTGAPDTRNAARWYDFRTNDWPTTNTAPTLAQSGQIQGPAGVHYSMPAININSNDDISLAMTKSSSAITADYVVVGRKKTDTLGSMSTPLKIASSTGTYGVSGFVNRWGDYFSVEIDPVDRLSFWAVTMVGRPNGAWGTEINHWNISTDLEGEPFTVGNPSVYAGTYSTGDRSGILTVDAFAYEVNSTFVKNLGQLAAMQVTVTSPMDAAATDLLTISANIDAPSGTTGQIFARNSSGGYDLLAAGQMGGGSRKVKITTSKVSTYVNSSRQMTLVIRALRPGRISTAPFVARFDQLRAGAVAK